VIKDPSIARFEEKIRRKDSIEKKRSEEEKESNSISNSRPKP
jgi:hypothetical protein